MRNGSRQDESTGISREYLAAVRQALRITSRTFDEELAALVCAAREDLTLSGIRREIVHDEWDPLILRAVTSYVKAEFGLDNDSAEQYRAAYDRLKIALAMSCRYTEGREPCTGKNKPAF